MPCVCKEERKRGRELVALESRMSSVKVQMPQMQEAWMGNDGELARNMWPSLVVLSSLYI